MRINLLIFLLIIPVSVFSQTSDTTIGYALKDCHLVNTRSDATYFCGIRLNATRISLVAKSIVQISYDNGWRSRLDTLDNIIFLYFTPDSIGSVKDSLFTQIKRYLVEKQESNRKYNIGYISFPYKSFFTTEVGPIAYSMTYLYNADRTNLVFYLKGEVFKIESKNGDLNYLIAFLEQNFQLKVNDEFISLKQTEKRIQVALDLLGL